MIGRFKAWMALFSAPMAALPVLAHSQPALIPAPLWVNQDAPWHTAYPLLQLSAARPDTTRITAQLTTANVFHLQKSRDEKIELDDEVQSLNLSASHPLSNRMDITLRTRWQRHDSGIWDSMIESWHEFFHLPNGGRELRDPERLYLAYDHDGSQTRVTYAAPGWQALNVEFGYTTETPPDQAGRWQVALGYTWSQSPSLGGNRLQLHAGYTHGWRLNERWTTQFGGGLSLLPPDRSDLNSLRARLRGQLRGTLSWKLFTQTIVLAQLDSHTPLYDSRVAPLGTLPMILTLAARYQHAQQTLEAGFGEDLNPGASPDWSTHLTWRYQW
ncbi:MAG: DUF3187 family protein [Gammaproteobacteria bacterium]|nr:MAG: DUF3187 family protein [Gammaproteobacteria bacterium]